MVDIFDEVSEDLRAEKAQQMLKRYGGLLVLAALLVLVAVGGWQAWRWRQTQQTNQVAAAFIGAMTLADGPTGAAAAIDTAARDQALQQFLGVAATGPVGYRTLARLRAAALRAAAGDGPAALALWDQVSADTAADPLLRDAANLMWVQHQIDQGDPPAVMGRLAPLVAPGNPWRPLALEEQALLLMRTGQNDKAREILTQLQSDAAAPDGVRARASGLLTRLAPATAAPEAPTSTGTGG